MKSVRIDFRQPLAPGLRATRLLLLGAGVAAIALGILQQRQIAAEAGALRWQIQSLGRLEARRMPPLQAASDAGSLSQEGVQRANQVLHQLNLPWDALFGALEQSVSAEVSMLAVTPDASRSSVVLKAAATDMDAIVDFMDNLRATRLLRGVHLISQDLDEQGGRHPLRFTLQAQWEAAP